VAAMYSLEGQIHRKTIKRRQDCAACAESGGETVLGPCEREGEREGEVLTSRLAVLIVKAARGGAKSGLGIGPEV
jgi:hypothetical protein